MARRIAEEDERRNGPGDGPGVLLEDLTWLEAEKRLHADTVVVVPIGAGAKEHGPHLRLSNDLAIADHLKRRLAALEDVVVAPTVSYHFYPAFREYPGSISLRLETAKALVVDICSSLAAFGPRRFYALNTGVSTVRALAPAKEALVQRGILLAYTEVDRVLGPIAREIGEQEGGTHADEIETSLMLVIAPDAVDMTKAVKDFDPRDRPGLSRTNEGPGCLSPTGIYGDPTLATREKGEKILEAYVAGLVRDVQALRAAPLS